jgi:hypothetical protein
VLNQVSVHVQRGLRVLTAAQLSVRPVVHPVRTVVVNFAIQVFEVLSVMKRFAQMIVGAMELASIPHAIVTLDIMAVIAHTSSSHQLYPKLKRCMELTPFQVWVAQLVVSYKSFKRLLLTIISVSQRLQYI